MATYDLLLTPKTNLKNTNYLSLKFKMKLLLTLEYHEKEPSSIYYQQAMKLIGRIDKRNV